MSVDHSLIVILARSPQVFGQDGNFRRKFGTGTAGSGDGELNCPNGVACSGTGELFVTDRSNKRVVVLDAGR